LRAVWLPAPRAREPAFVWAMAAAPGWCRGLVERLCLVVEAEGQPKVWPGGPVRGGCRPHTTQRGAVALRAFRANFQVELVGPSSRPGGSAQHSFGEAGGGSGQRNSLRWSTLLGRGGTWARCGSGKTITRSTRGPLFGWSGGHTQPRRWFSAVVFGLGIVIAGYWPELRFLGGCHCGEAVCRRGCGEPRFGAGSRGLTHACPSPARTPRCRGTWGGGAF